MINNPVLTGFHPDPSMIFVDGVFYIANSTFEYYPGVKISKSSDLANWETVGYPVTHQFNLHGAPPECGIWAPALSHYDGKFYLVFTDVKTTEMGPAKDTPNYIITSQNIEGPWSEPIYINSSGFDPSLFHDDDGRKYFVNMEWDYRKPELKKFSGILLTELDPQTLKPISEPKKIFTGTDRGLVEAPHLYKKDGWYYLFTAEGGTSYDHATTVARSKTVDGLYEVSEQPYLVSAKDFPDNYLQKTGHGSICQDHNGRWWFAFLCGRPLPNTKYCNLGRETSIAEIEWIEDWPRLKSGGIAPEKSFIGYGEQKPLEPINISNFNDDVFKEEFQSLRVAPDYTILENGTLRLFGKDFINSRNFQNMFVTRQRSFCFQVETCVTNVHNHFMRFGGITLRYSEANQYYLQFVYDDQLDSKVLQILEMKDNNFSIVQIEKILIPSNMVHLKLKAEYDIGYFYYSLDGINYSKIDYALDMSILSDDFQKPIGFTGTMVGIAATDMQYANAEIDFLYFNYTNL